VAPNCELQLPLPKLRAVVSLEKGAEEQATISEESNSTGMALYFMKHPIVQNM
jgi:hypothetical protein